MSRTLLLILLLTASLPGKAAASDLSCPGGIVSSGDPVVELIMKCGQPAWKESHQEEITDRTDPNLKVRTYVTVEQWTYDLGPQQLIRLVTIRNGVVSWIRTTNTYGALRDQAPAGPECGGRIISIGDMKSDVFAKCGEPFYKTSHDEEVWMPAGGNASRKVIVTVEEWTYNFGPQRFMRIITFRNGKVSDIRTGGYGQ